jgi:hypothetical protein
MGHKGAFCIHNGISRPPECHWPTQGDFSIGDNGLDHGAFRSLCPILDVACIKIVIV